MSSKYTKIKEYYEKGFWSAGQVSDAVGMGWITEEEYAKITGTEYDGKAAETLAQRVEDIEANQKLLLEWAVNSGEISTDDISGAVRDAVKADIEGGLVKDFP